MERREARSLGLSKYVNDRPCMRGHVGLRYTKTGACVICVKECAKEFRRKTEVKANRANLVPVYTTLDLRLKEIETSGFDGNTLVHPEDIPYVRQFVATLNALEWQPSLEYRHQLSIDPIYAMQIRAAEVVKFQTYKSDKLTNLTDLLSTARKLKL